MKLVLIGPPGAGKGTQADNLTQWFGIPAISTGLIIRKAMELGSEVGKQAAVFIERGELVPDQMVIQMVQERLAQPDVENGYILDGFPRTVAQAQEMDRLGIGVDKVLDIVVPDDTLVERLSGRRVCKACGASFHVVYNPPAQEGVCDKCGAPLSLREDDKPEVIRARLAVYHRQTEPLKAYYQQQNKLVTVVGQEKVEDTTALVKAAVGAGGASADAERV